MAVARSLGFDSLTSDSRAPNLLVGRGVEIDPTAQLGANLVIYDNVKIGANALIKHNCVIGERPTLAPDSHAIPQAIGQTQIGAGATICNGVIILAGATVGQNTIIGDQAFIREGSVTAGDCVIGRGCLVSTGATVGARTKIQAQSMVMPGMTIEEDVRIGGGLCGATDNSIGADPDQAQTAIVLRRGCRVGAAVCLLPGIEIGEEAFIGAGAVVLESVPARTKVAGVPARTIGVVAGEDLL